MPRACNTTGWVTPQVNLQRTTDWQFFDQLKQDEEKIYFLLPEDYLRLAPNPPNLDECVNPDAAKILAKKTRNLSQRLS
ncbi:MAG TPA: hypothetical protein V6C90_07370 [Coleofasciculaceae cyanobacterium]